MNTSRGAIIPHCIYFFHFLLVFVILKQTFFSPGIPLRDSELKLSCNARSGNNDAPRTFATGTGSEGRLESVRVQHELGNRASMPKKYKTLWC